MRNTTQFRIYSCCILLVLLCGCETWTLTSVDRWHTPNNVGIKWSDSQTSDFISNVDARAASGQESIVSLVWLRRLQLFGHIARMAYTVTTEAILSLACDGREGSHKATRLPDWRDHEYVFPLPGFVKLPTTAVSLRQKLYSWRLPVRDQWWQ